mgnify:CR=1 FL=1
MIFYSFVYEKRYNRMGSLDEKISVVKAKPWLDQFGLRGVYRLPEFGMDLL